jgi:predicted nucleic acid-binding protein
VVDASVAYKWCYREDEEGVAQADELLEDHHAGRVMISGPTSLPVELANALRYSRQSPERIAELIDLIDAVHLHLYYTDPELLKSATRLALEHRLSVYDAVYLALAERLSCPLITSDRKAFDQPGLPAEVRFI